MTDDGLNADQQAELFTGVTHQIAGKPESIVVGVEADFVQQDLQLVETALHVADGVYRHGLSPYVSPL